MSVTRVKCKGELGIERAVTTKSDAVVVMV